MKQPNDLVGFLGQIGVAGLPHAGQTYVEHCVGVHDGLAVWGFPEEICQAGFMHSVYGTERFEGVRVPGSRETIRTLIGRRAEALAYANCALPRKTLDEELCGKSPFTDRAFSFRSRTDDSPIVVQQSDLVAFCAIHLSDWLDQVPLTSEWHYRFTTYERLATWLGSPALDSFRWVYRRNLE